MRSQEKRLEPNNDTLNPDPPRFGMPWWCVLVIITIAAAVFFIPGCRFFGFLLTPASLLCGWWITKDDPKEPQLILHDLLLPNDFDPAK